MKAIELHITLNDQLGITGVIINYNDTGLPSDSNLIKLTAVALLKALRTNADDVAVQDLLNELNIKRTPNDT